MAADQENESNEWQHSHNIRVRAFSSIFASAVIKSLTSKNGVAMQPKDPNDNQVAAFNAYTRSIIDTCGRDAPRFWSKENLTFGAQDDEREGAGNGRTAIPLDSPLIHFSDCWGKLVDVPNARDPTEKLPLGRHLISTGETVSGLPRGASAYWREAMMRAMFTGDIRTVARLFLKTCPGDWARGWNVGLPSMLSDAVEHGIEPQQRHRRKNVDITEFIRYRWGLAEMADSFVEEYKLRKPNHETCLFWKDYEWTCLARRTIPGFESRYSLAQGYLFRGGHDHMGFYPGPMPSQGPYFFRIVRYLAAAVVSTDLPQEETDRVLKKLGGSYG